MNTKVKDDRVQELFLLQRVAQRINSILDLEALLEEVVSDVAQTFGYSRSAVLLKDEATNELVIAAVRGWTVNYHMKGDRFKIGEYGMVGHVGAIEETYYAPDVTVDPYYEISEESTRSEVDIPLKVHGHLIGVFNFQHHESHAFSQGRIQLLQALAEHVATAIENARLFQQERMERERMTGELEDARNIQTSLFPDQSPYYPGFEITGTCLPSRQVGGDWFDYISLPDGRLGLVLADVAGKGMGASLLMASTRSILRLFAEQGLSTGDVLAEVNRVLITDFPKTKFVTMIYAILDPQKRTLEFSNAGHLPPLYKDSAGTGFVEVESGLPLGVRETRFTEYSLALPAGSFLLLYSDGICEARNSSSEEYGLERLRDHMAQPDASVPGLMEDVRSFTDGQPASDDITLLMVRSR